MKVIFLSPLDKKTENLSKEDIKGTPALYTYYLRTEFQKLGVESQYCTPGFVKGLDVNLESIVIPPGDHIISVYQRLFTRWCKNNKEPIKHIKKSIRGKITSICDHETQNPIEDILFYSLPTKHELNKNKYIGCSIDPLLLYPQKDPLKIRILVDHPYYGTDNRDQTYNLSKECLKFQNNNKDKKIEIRRFGGPDGVEDVNINNVKPSEYVRMSMATYPKACEEYRKADIYLVTHPESLGLSVIESAACGSLILAPEGFIRPVMLQQSHFITFPKTQIPWDLVMNDLNKRPYKTTKQKTWTETAIKILNDLERKI